MVRDGTAIRIDKNTKELIDNLKYDLQAIERNKVSHEEILRRTFSPKSPIANILLEDSVLHKSRKVK